MEKTATPLNEVCMRRPAMTRAERAFDGALIGAHAVISFALRIDANFTRCEEVPMK
jgi:hypothetical protein